MSDQISTALIGAGFWGKNLARNFYQLGALKLICDPSEEILNRKKEKYPGIDVSVSFSDAISRRDIEAVVIAAPAEKHYPMVKESLLSGKHVFVEKPLALTVLEGEELVQLAKSTGKTLFIGHILQYHPAVQKIKELLKTGELGKLQYIYSNRLNLGKIRREENILWSFAPHDLSIILSFANEEPQEVQAVGSNILHPSIADITLTHLRFPSGITAHIFVSWLHPFKEQKLVVIGERKMVVFSDSAPIEEKLVLYPHNILWQDGMPIPEKKEGILLNLAEDWQEPLLNECRAFLEGVTGQPILTDGQEGLRVLRVLQRAQESMDRQKKLPDRKDYFIHESSVVDEGCLIGKGTKIWHNSHILKESKIGQNVNIGQNVMIGSRANIGNHVKIQNNVSIYEGVELEDYVFCGPSCVFTNVINPRSAIPRKDVFQPTLVKKGATIGANATILCGITIGKFSFVGAGAVVTKNVPDHALVYGNPATLQGWMCECGNRLDENKFCGHCQKIPQIL
ncbi:MAG: Gfo/Idh/MocA family oxidoreductase [Nitrospinota bacterium]|nr:Gfo/Idh/MocA family oxidoreductase [Nitrospinota bacterium]